MEAEERIRRREALARLEALREKIAARNQDLSEEQAEDLVDRFIREVIEKRRTFWPSQLYILRHDVAAIPSPLL